MDHTLRMIELEKHSVSKIGRTLLLMNEGMKIIAESRMIWFSILRMWVGTDATAE